jgi:hypothetical protein
MAVVYRRLRLRRFLQRVQLGLLLRSHCALHRRCRLMSIGCADRWLSLALRRIVK